MAKTLLAVALLCAGLSLQRTRSAQASSDASHPDQVIQWNRTLLQLLQTPGAQPATVHPTRSMAIVHLAIYDAVNAIRGGHAPYLVLHAPRSASPDAATALELLRPRRPPLGGPLDGSQGPAATAAAAVAVEAASGRASFPRRSPLDERSQAPEGIVPLLRDSVQVSARLLEAPRLELPDALASATFAAHETRSGERMKVLRDGLARDGSG